MTPVLDRLKQYTQRRGDGIAEADAQRVVVATLQRLQRPPSARRHWRNAASALAAALLVTAGLVLLQLRSTPTKIPVQSPPITLPNDVIQLSQGDVIQPFRIRDRQLDPPRSAWLVAAQARLTLTYAIDCSQTVFRVVDPVTGQDERPPVNAPGCFSDASFPLLLSDGTVLLEHYKLNGAPNNPATRPVSLGLDRYDWRAGRVTQTYPVPFPRDLVLAPDGQHVYALTASVTGVVDCGDSNCESIIHDTVELLDLQSRTITASFDAGSHQRFDFGQEHRLALSADGRSLYVNESSQLLIFDTQRPGLPAAVSLNGPQATRPAWPWPGLLVTAEAKELAGKSIAVDPGGRWVAVLGETAERAPFGPPNGIWLVSTIGPPRLVGHVHAHDGFYAIASSPDGSVVYLLEVGGGGRYLLVIDPLTGKDLADVLVCTSTSCQGFYGITGVTPADQ